MVVDNERCACAVVGRIEVCWMPHGGFCWPRRLIHQLLQFCSRFKHAKRSLGLVPSNKCAGWTSGNMHDKDVSRMHRYRSDLSRRTRIPQTRDQEARL